MKGTLGSGEKLKKGTTTRRRNVLGDTKNVGVFLLINSLILNRHNIHSSQNYEAMCYFLSRQVR